MARRHTSWAVFGILKLAGRISKSIINLYFSWIRCVSTNSRNLAIYCHHLRYPNPTFDYHLASKYLFYIALAQNVEFNDGYEQVL